ncbi:MAG: hypothetical protein WC417_05530 [Candidatus Omnitrophota bacterium]|jgi:tetratricopeptide (TPR) repeat protein
MQNAHRNVLIVTAVVIVIFSVSLNTFFYTQNSKIKDSLANLKIRFEALQKESSSLQEENSVLRQQLKDNGALLDKALEEKAALEKKISVVNEDLSALKSESVRLQESIRDKENTVLLLQKENEKLKSDKDAKEAQIKKSDSDDNLKKIDKEAEAIIQKAGLNNIKPKDFISDFNGNEQFLQNCSSTLCKKIILNSSGIKYAKSEEWQKAEAAFKEALSNDPNYKPAKLNLGLVYDEIKSKKEALDYWLKAYDIKF